MSVFESHVALLERQTNVRLSATADDRAAFLSDLAFLHTAIFNSMERHVGAEGLSEVHRPLVPLFQRWITTARRIVDAARQTHTGTRSIDGMGDLVLAINRAKLAAEDFDSVIALNERIAKGESEPHRSLREVVNELRAAPQPPRFG